MAKLRNKFTGKYYEVTDKEATDIMSSSKWGSVFTQINEPKKPEPIKKPKPVKAVDKPKKTETPKELIAEKDDVKEVKKASKEKKDDK